MIDRGSGLPVRPSSTGAKELAPPFLKMSKRPCAEASGAPGNNSATTQAASRPGTPDAALARRIVPARFGHVMHEFSIIEPGHYPDFTVSPSAKGGLRKRCASRAGFRARHAQTSSPYRFRTSSER
jgi:hypothetical protein